MNNGAGNRLVVSTLAMTLVIQTLTSLAMIVPSVLAPVAAADLGVEPSRIGILFALNYLAASVAGVVSGALVVRHGPVRVLQFAVILVAVGLVAGSGGTLPLAFCLGLLAGTAHGMVNPASSTILLQASPPQYRSLIFSLKQTGVPMGGAIAGIVIPAMLQIMPWRQTLLTLGLASTLFLLLLIPYRPVYDGDANPRQRVGISGIVAPILEVSAHPDMLGMALTSAVYSAVQVSLFSYLVLYLHVELGFTLVAAGLVFAVAQGFGVVGRPFWGAIADRLQAPRRILGILGICMAFCGIACALSSSSWPVAAITAVCAFYGATAIGWNGVYLAEVARTAPAGKVGLITGGTQVFTFSGVVIGPPLFGAVVGLTEGYAWSFVLFALIPLVPGLRLALSAGDRALGRR